METEVQVLHPTLIVQHVHQCLLQTQKPMSKTEESYMTKGDKSYYYWHKHVKNTVPIEPPPLLHTEVVTVVEEEWKPIYNYSWMDDDDVVKYVLLSNFMQIINAAQFGLIPLKTAAQCIRCLNLACNFTF
jgi:hypothetical protein